MIFDAVLPAPPGSRFDPHAFDTQIGREIPLGPGTATVLAASVSEDGRTAVLRFRAADDLLGAEDWREISALHVLDSLHVLDDGRIVEQWAQPFWLHFGDLPASPPPADGPPR